MRVLFAVVMAALALPAVAQQAVTLPGGASAVTETHGDWTVRCQVRQPEGRISCLVQQEQVDNQSRQRLLAMEVVPNGDGVLGTLILPFGLDLDKGVTVSVDEGQPLPNLRFRTCLPQGCMVSLSLAADMTGAMRSGGALKVAAIADGGAPTPFTVSLSGFASALARAQELSK
jgi:invasion protein IalB